MTKTAGLLACVACILSACSGGAFYVTEGNAMKYCYADVAGNSDEELVLLTPSGETTPYGPAGETLYILSAGKSLYGRHEIISQFDVKKMRPLNVMAGDVNRDGVKEVSLKVYKTSEYDPEFAQRPFFFNVSRGKLEAVWLGTRLSQPIVDYAPADLNGDGFDEIAALETVPGGYRLAAYEWDSFGFACFAHSEAYPSLEGIYNMESPEGWMKIALERFVVLRKN